MARRAYTYGRSMLWSRVAEDYERLFMRMQMVPHDTAVRMSPAIPVPSA